MLKKLLRTGSRSNAVLRRVSPKENWGFTYIGGSSSGSKLPASDRQGSLSGTVPESSAFPLSRAQVGDRLCVTQLRGSRSVIQELQALGFCCGTTIQVISRQASGSVVVTVGTSRLGLGASMAQQVMVSSASA